jgi:DNA-binding response OmpR family regulator
VKRPTLSTIWMISNDVALTYLIRRYAEQGGYSLDTKPAVPPVEEVRASKPSAILFPSVETLEAAVPWIETLASHAVPILVCSSVSDQARARELGADSCLLHPLTYEGFLIALTGTRLSE